MVIPKGIIVVDVHEDENTSTVMEASRSIPGCIKIKTPRGIQLLYKDTTANIIEWIKVEIKDIGIKAKLSNKGYVILPINTIDRYILSIPQTLSIIPPALLTYNEVKKPLTYSEDYEEYDDEEAVNFVLSQLGDAKSTSQPGQWQALCPFHDDNIPSFSFNELKGVYYCHACGEGSTIKNLLRLLKGLSPRPITYKSEKKEKHNEKGRIVDAYNYVDENHKVLYQVVRFEPKNFVVRKPGTNGKKWEWTAKGVRNVLYNLPEVIKAETVYLPEGEKDARTLNSKGYTATTTAANGTSKGL